MDSYVDTEAPWQARALCYELAKQGLDVTDIFFPYTKRYGNNTATMNMSYAQAKVICDKCPVREECLEWELAMEASAHGVGGGMFGGKTPRERRKILRERKRRGTQ